MTDNLPPAYGGKRPPTPAPAKPTPANPWLVTLVVVGVVAMVLAGILAMMLSQSRTTTDATAEATLAAWSNFMLLVSVILLAAASVVGGVSWALRRAGLGA